MGDPTERALFEVNLNEVMEELDYDEDKREATVGDEMFQKDNSNSHSEASSKEDGVLPYSAGIEEERKSESSSIEMDQCDGQIKGRESDDVEEGEIRELSDSEFLSKYSCRFFHKGRCIWGKDCRFLHLSDKGLYSMFDAPVLIANVSREISLMRESCCTLQPRWSVAVVEANETVWDRALKEAKELIKQSKIRKKEEHFEEKKLYMSVEKDDIYVDKCEHPRTSVDNRKNIVSKSHILSYKRVVREISPRFVLNKFKTLRKDLKTVKPKSVRTAYVRKTSYNSEWRDPWRRSKTPLKRKRSPSRSVSDSSGSSSCSCDSRSSSWSSSKCRTPSPKRVRRTSRTKTFSNGRTARKRSSAKSTKRSRSSKRSQTSRSDSSNGFTSRKLRTRSQKRLPKPKKRKKKKRKSYSPAFRKRRSPPISRFRAKLSTERVVTYRKSPRSVSFSPSPSKSKEEKSRHTDTEEKECSGASYKIQQTLNYRSCSSNSSRCSASKLIITSNRSCSDMSISPLSESSVSRRSECCDKLNKTPPPTASASDTKNSRNSKTKDNQPSAVDIKQQSATLRSITSKQNYCSVTNSILDRDTRSKPKKKVSPLEMELWKYRSDTRSSLDDPEITTSKKARVSATVSTPTNCKILENSHLTEKKAVKCSENTSKNKNGVSARRMPSKREILLKQLKSVEEAIARKKKYMYCTT